jgi:Ca2+-binding RTX toxin-like protein
MRLLFGRRTSTAIACALALALTLSASAGTALADDAACSYDAASRTVSVQIVAHGENINPTVVRDIPGAIGLFDDGVSLPAPSCPGGSSVSNTDTVAITDVPMGGSFIGITVAQGLLTGGVLRFAPGFADEPGGSDEIEFDVDLGAGKDGFFLDYRAPAAANHTVLGGKRINLNAGEGDGIDADVTLRGTESVDFHAATGVEGEPGDVIDARGGAGTPAEAFRLRLFADGRKGDDLLIGGRVGDQLLGEEGDDRVRGMDGDDDPSGEEGNDRVKGGKGRDLVEGGPGSDLIDGGPGRDECRGGPGKDTFKRCESIKK